VFQDGICSDDSATFSLMAARRGESAPARASCGELLGGSARIQEVYRRIDKVAPTTATVLIIGESGSGKEVVAHVIHAGSQRAQQPFLAVNCGAIPGNLVEAEIFGYEKGAFTGAGKTHHGCFERAEGGTLFLDEITEMGPDMQVRLLRVLESARYCRVGGELELRANVRIIAATNRDPQEAVQNGQLREDLLYRLAVFPINIPPLRDREGDAELLAEHFLRQLNEASRSRKMFSRRAVSLIRSHAWPGNVRELKNAVHRAFILSDDLIEFDDSDLTHADPPRECLNIPVGAPLAEIERQAIYSTLGLCDGNKRRCAEMLGVGLRTLYNRLAEFRAIGPPSCRTTRPSTNSLQPPAPRRQP
jgi:DNA-binding NtrC family response regulator